jgi:hypothetical protein
MVFGLWFTLCSSYGSFSDIAPPPRRLEPATGRAQSNCAPVARCAKRPVAVLAVGDSKVLWDAVKFCGVAEGFQVLWDAGFASVFPQHRGDAGNEKLPHLFFISSFAPLPGQDTTTAPHFSEETAPALIHTAPLESPTFTWQVWTSTSLEAVHKGMVAEDGDPEDGEVSLGCFIQPTQESELLYTASDILTTFGMALEIFER